MRSNSVSSLEEGYEEPVASRKAGEPAITATTEASVERLFKYY
jgi:hypothetical protein